MAGRGSAVGFVVAGGQSLRMGRDKALLDWRGGTLLDHAIARLRTVTADVRLLCGPERRYADRGLPLVTDVVAEAGAFGGVLSGLGALDGPRGLFLAVDLPGVPVSLLRRLVDLAEGVDAVVPVSPRGPEPLCAVYASSCLGPMRRRREAGDLRMTGFWPELRVLSLGPEALEEFGDPGGMFQNLNELRDYEAAARAAG